MSYNWGPFFIVPSEKTSTFSRRVVLREKFDEARDSRDSIRNSTFLT